MKPSRSLRLIALLLAAGCSNSTPTGPGSVVQPPLGIGTGLIVFVPIGLFPGDSDDALAQVASTQGGVTVFVPTTEATWLSSNPSVARVTIGGRVTAVAPGTAQLTATYQARSASATLSVAAEADLAGVDLTCPKELLSGEASLCLAAARLRSGAEARATFEWSSTRPDVVAVDAQGMVRGQSTPGLATIVATYRGRRASADVVVTAKDALHVSATAEQGALRPGGSVSWTVLGFYAVQTAPTGQLTVSITNQENTALTTVSRSVPRGGDSFSVVSAFEVPAGSARESKAYNRGMSRTTRTLSFAAVVYAVVVVSLGAQAPATPNSYQPPKTPWGDPDLQGIWPSTDMVGVPFERPKQFGTRLFLTDAEFTARQQQANKQAALDVLEFDLEKPPDEVVALGDVGGVTSPPPHWLERGTPSRQSSLIVDPANGQLPPMTPDGVARQKGSGGTYTKQTGWNNASELSAYDRCISRGPVGSMMPVVYNNGNEIIQAPGLVAFRNEMIHETRIIPLDDRPMPPSSFTGYMGYSRGHFEGNTLVVRTTNLNGKTGAQGNGSMLLNSGSAVLTERFTPVSKDVLQYEVTVDDPKTWTAPWRVSFPLKRESDYGFYEYACHEGNYAMRNTLSGSRSDEKR